MTIVHIPDPVRPAEVHVPAELVIPPGVSRHDLLGHAMRMARFHREHGDRRPPTGREATAWSQLPRFALALSWAFDLGLVDWTVQALVRAAWPLRWSSGPSPKDVIASDVPRYDAGDPPVMDHRCFGHGPRGGRCRTGDAQPARRLVNPATGEWVYVWACDGHAATLRGPMNQAPTPAPNRGGALAVAFPDVDLDPVYRWADDRYDGDSAPEAMPDRPVRLRVIPGGAR